MRYYQLLKELKFIGDKDDKDGKNIIFNVFDGNIFIYDSNTEDEITDEIIERYPDLEIDNLYDIYDINDSLPANKRMYIGYIRDNVLEIQHTDQESADTILSTQVQKIVKELDLDGVTYTDTIYTDDDEVDVSETVPRDEVIGANVKTAKMYHGTTTTFLPSIIKKGIQPTPVSNFVVEHEDKVFVTTRYGKAVFHAIKASNEHGGSPVVIVVTIPDPAKLVLDYDIAIQQYGTNHPLTVSLGYDMIHKSLVGFDFENVIDQYEEEWKNLADKSSLNTKAGVFGYSGRIPPTFIKGLYADPKGGLKDFTEENYDTDLDIKVEADNLKLYKSYSEYQEDVQSLIDEFISEMEDDDDE